MIAMKRASSSTYGRATLPAMSAYHSGTAATAKHVEAFPHHGGQVGRKAGSHKEVQHPLTLLACVEVSHLEFPPQHDVSERARAQGREEAQGFGDQHQDFQNALQRL